MTQLRTGLRWGLGLLVAVGLLGIAGGAHAQAEPVLTGPRTFGTSATTSHTLHAYGFTGFEASDAAAFRSSFLAARYCTSICFPEAPLLLPAGAQVTAIELDGCDHAVGGDVGVDLFRVGRGRERPPLRAGRG